METESLIISNSPDTFVHLWQTLNDYGEAVKELYRRKLRDAGKVASSDLINSVEYKVRSGESAWTVSLDLAFYWKFVEGGSKGTESSPAGAVYKAHFPPPQAIFRWINIKPVIPRPDARGRIPTPKQLSYLIGRKIKERGIEPTPALQDTLDELNAVWTPKITEAFARDCSDIFRTMTVQTFEAMTKR